MLTTRYEISAPDAADRLYAAQLRLRVARACGVTFDRVREAVAQRLDEAERFTGVRQKRAWLPIPPDEAAEIAAGVFRDFRLEGERIFGEVIEEIRNTPCPIGQTASVALHSFRAGDTPDPPDIWRAIAQEIEAACAIVEVLMADLPVGLDVRISLAHSEDCWPTGCCNVDDVRSDGTVRLRHATITVRLPHQPGHVAAFATTHVVAHEVFIHAYQQFDTPRLTYEEADGPYVFSEGFMDAATVALLEASDLDERHKNAARRRSERRGACEAATLTTDAAQWADDLGDGHDAWRYLVDAGRFTFDPEEFGEREGPAAWAVRVAAKLNVCALDRVERCALLLAFRRTWSGCHSVPADEGSTVLPDDARRFLYIFQSVRRPDPTLAQATERIRAQLAGLPGYEDAHQELTRRPQLNYL